ncbi:MAG: hypothetical protein F6K00_19555 [Leptolyngbya sp. SIOISBB]|nr:hypothetical protein [Leptolyngbya sp. SIOISBB]
MKITTVKPINKAQTTEEKIAATTANLIREAQVKRELEAVERWEAKLAERKRQLRAELAEMNYESLLGVLF